MERKKAGRRAIQRPKRRQLVKVDLPPAAAGLCALIIMAYLLSLFVPLNSLALSPSLAYSQPWTLLTHIFLHANPAHLLSNLLALFMFGILLEREMGTRNFLLLFFISGLAAGIGETLIAEPLSYSLGASGAIFGIMGALAILRPKAIIFVEFIPVPMAVAAIGYGIFELLFLRQQDGTAHPAHFFGLLLGVLYGLYLRSKK